MTNESKFSVQHLNKFGRSFLKNNKKGDYNE